MRIIGNVLKVPVTLLAGAAAAGGGNAAMRAAAAGVSGIGLDDRSDTWSVDAIASDSEADTNRQDDDMSNLRDVDTELRGCCPFGPF